jgi:hypothetical protein
VPMLFSTGYDRSGLVPERFAAVPLVGKPFEAEDLVDAVARLMGAS